MQLDLLTWNEIRVQGVYTKGAKSISAAIDFQATRGQRYPLDRMISHVFPLEEAEKAISLSGGGGGEDFVKAAVVP
jgi:hypothetical protein